MTDYYICKDDELCHFGIKGMRLGVRKKSSSGGSNQSSNGSKSVSENIKHSTNRQKAKVQYGKDKGPRRYGVFNAANSAARTYYRKERTNSFKTYRKQDRKLDIRTARLTNDQVKNGRYRVARARNIKRKTVSGLLGTAAGAALVYSGTAAVAPFAGVGVATIGNFASGAHYYSRQKRSYGATRAKYENK